MHETARQNCRVGSNFIRSHFLIHSYEKIGAPERAKCRHRVGLDLGGNNGKSLKQFRKTADCCKMFMIVIRVVICSSLKDSEKSNCKVRGLDRGQSNGQGAEHLSDNVRQFQYLTGRRM